MLASDNYKNTYNIDTKNYKVGMYLRLSKEDENTEQSESIKNQREFITRYILDNGWDLFDEYIDDGFSGTNFDRPDFQRMITDIEKGFINLVIVKDYSRFGRNYVRTGMYLEEFFPLHNIRFIAINDGIDTFKKNNCNNELSGFKGIMNDMYSADISKKIRTSFNSKRQNGKFIGAFAPYGYQKDPNDKNKLIVDLEASLIVKRIFNMRVTGIGNEEIMRTLNRENIPCPTMYKKQKGLNYQNANIIHYVWTAETIKDILSNPIYIGNMAQRKSERISYKIRKHIKISRENWIVVENTHEPIIDKEIFHTIQEFLRKKSYGKTEHKTEHLLGGLLVCGECGMPLTFRREIKGGKKEFITLCSNYSRFHKCTRHALLEKYINELVIKELKVISQKAIKDKKAFMQRIQKPTFEQYNDNIKTLIQQKEKRKTEIVALRKALYEDWKKGYITKKVFDSMHEDYNKEKEHINYEISNWLSETKKSEQTVEKVDFYQLLKQIVDFKIVSKQILMSLIEKVDIFQDKTIQIHYKFQKPINLSNA